MESLHSGSAYVNLTRPYIGLVYPHGKEKHGYRSHHSGRVGAGERERPGRCTKEDVWGVGEREMGELIQL